MYPFIWSEGGGSQDSVMVVELIEMTERLLGGALGAMYRQEISSVCTHCIVSERSYKEKRVDCKFKLVCGHAVIIIL